MMQILRQRHMRGFTLIETLVALSMLSIVIATVASLVQASLIAGKISKDDITAKYLAEEGIEYIRNLRDYNVVNNGQTHWLDNIAKDASSPCGNTTLSGIQKTCDIDSVNGTTPTNCGGSTSNCSAYPLLYNGSTGQYYHGVGTASKFYRTISVSLVDSRFGSPISVLVQATVTWTSNYGTYSYTAYDYLFDWYTGS